jgi:hypothetical protein
VRDKWSWCTAEWDTLPETLARLEADGEQIFAIIPTGDRDRYLKVVYYKALWPQHEKDKEG